MKKCIFRKGLVLAVICLLMLLSLVIPAVSIQDRSNENIIKNPSSCLINYNQQNIISKSSTDNVWDKTYGGRSYDDPFYATPTTDGGYIFCGATGSYETGGGMYDGWVVKTDLYGNELWNKSKGGDRTDLFTCVQQASDGGYILTGYKQYSYETGKFDLWLLKIDASGTWEWDKTYGGKDWDMGVFVQQTTDGGYIIVGRTEQYNKAEDMWLVKTDDNGNLLWDKAFNTGTLEYGWCVQQTSDGGYILLGHIFSFGMPATIAGWAIKTDSDGNVEWDKKIWYGTDDCKTRYVYQTSDGGYIIAGGTACFSFGNTGVDAWLIKLDENGNEEWNRTYPEQDNQEAKCVQQTSDGGYIFTGIAKGDLRLVKTDAMGNVEWERRFGGSRIDSGVSVQQVSDGGYIVGGSTYSYGAGYEDFWLIKTDENGQLNESNHRPIKPVITGPTYGNKLVEYPYNVTSTDPDGDMIYYWFDWGDGYTSGWIGPYKSGGTGKAIHTWTKMGEYKIHVKAMDVYGREGEWSDPLEVTMPRNRPINGFFQRFLEQFPILQKILQRLGLQ